MASWLGRWFPAGEIVCHEGLARRATAGRGGHRQEVGLRVPCAGPSDFDIAYGRPQADAALVRCGDAAAAAIQSRPLSVVSDGLGVRVWGWILLAALRGGNGPTGAGGASSGRRSALAGRPFRPCAGGRGGEPRTDPSARALFLPRWNPVHVPAGQVVHRGHRTVVRRRSVVTFRSVPRLGQWSGLGR